MCKGPNDMSSPVDSKILKCGFPLFLIIVSCLFKICFQLSMWE